MFNNKRIKKIDKVLQSQILLNHTQDAVNDSLLKITINLRKGLDLLLDYLNLEVVETPKKRELRKRKK